MSIEVREFETMVVDTLDRISNNTNISNIQPGSVIRTIIESILAENDIQYYQLQQLFNAMGVDTATGSDLDRLVSILGVVRKPATKCTGVVTFSRTTASLSDIPIEQSQIISTPPDKNGNIIQFVVTDDDAVLDAGDLSVDVNVEAMVGGSVYIPAGGLSIMNTPIIGIESVANGDVVSGGTDEETDDDFRVRAESALAGLGKGTLESLRSAVMNINGVLDAITVDMSRGLATADVIVVTSVIPPSSELVEEIEDVIADTKAAGIDVGIIYPTIHTVDVSITITGFTDEDAIANAIIAYTDSLRISDSFIINQMERYVLNAAADAGVNDADIATVAPEANVSISGTEIVRLGTITINGVVYSG